MERAKGGKADSREKEDADIRQLTQNLNALSLGAKKSEVKIDKVEGKIDLKDYGFNLHNFITDPLMEGGDDLDFLENSINGLCSNIEKFNITCLLEEILPLCKFLKALEQLCKRFLLAKDSRFERYYTSFTSACVRLIVFFETAVDEQITGYNIDIHQYKSEANLLTAHNLVTSLNSGMDFFINSVLMQKLKLLISDKFIKALTINEMDGIYACLLTYTTLNRQLDAEYLYDKIIVTPALTDIFNTENLVANRNNLDSLYFRATEFFENDMMGFLEFVDSNRDLTGYSFILNTYWKTADGLLRENLPKATPYGTPDFFHKLYQSTTNFVMHIRDCLRPEEQDQPSFQQHLDRFNLQEYYLIRHQQICEHFAINSVREENMEVEENNDDTGLYLKPSLAFWKASLLCFHPKIYLTQSCKQFICLATILQARYLSYVLEMARKGDWEKMRPEDFIIVCSEDVKLMKNTHGCTILKKFVKQIYKPKHQQEYKFLVEATITFEKSFDIAHGELLIMLANINANREKLALLQIGGMPASCRNRSKKVLTEPSKYVLSVVRALFSFHYNYVKLIKESALKVADVYIHKIGEAYLAAIVHMLRPYIEEPKEPPKRTKGRHKAEKGNGSKKIELSKIKQQLEVDVAFFSDNFKPFIINPQSKILDQLQVEVANINS